MPNRVWRTVQLDFFPWTVPPLTHKLYTTVIKKKKKKIQKSQKQFWMYFWLLLYEQPLNYSIDLSLSQYWHTQTWLVISRPICESVRSSHLFFNWTTMVTRWRQCDNVIYAWYFRIWSNRITSGQQRHIPIYSWCFNPPPFSVFDHFPVFFEGRDYVCIYAFSDLSI